MLLKGSKLGLLENSYTRELVPRRSSTQNEWERVLLHSKLEQYDSNADIIFGECEPKYQI